MNSKPLQNQGNQLPDKKTSNSILNITSSKNCAVFFRPRYDHSWWTLVDQVFSGHFHLLLRLSHETWGYPEIVVAKKIRHDQLVPWGITRLPNPCLGDFPAFNIPKWVTNWTGFLQPPVAANFWWSMILGDYTNQNIGGYQHPLGESHSSNQSTSIKTTKQGFEHRSNGGISEWLSILMILPAVFGQTLIVGFNEIRHIFLLHMRTFHRKSEEKALTSIFVSKGVSRISNVTGFLNKFWWRNHAVKPLSSEGSTTNVR